MIWRAIIRCIWLRNTLVSVQVPYCGCVEPDAFMRRSAERAFLMNAKPGNTEKTVDELPGQPPKGANNSEHDTAQLANQTVDHAPNMESTAEIPVSVVSSATVSVAIGAIVK